MTKLIKLTFGQYSLVDDDDYEILIQYKWSAGYAKDIKQYYALAYKRDADYKKTVRMHRMIMNCPDGMDVDHINHNTLDNRKCNLRICNRSVNVLNSRLASNNTSGYKGVSWNKWNGKWWLRVNINGKRKHIGYYENKIEAALDYDILTTKYNGKYVFVNFPMYV